MPEAKYRVLINDNTFTFAIVTDPGVYDQAALAVGASVAQREQIVANHKGLQTDYKSYITIQKVSKDFIIYAQALKSCTWHTVWSRMRQYLCS